MSLPAGFWSKTTTTDCVIWTGAVNSKGYACVNVGGVSQLAHRLAYEDAHGPIHDDQMIDHLCRVRNCVNVAHLELVTAAENNRRKRVAIKLIPGGECFRGHRLTDDNLYRRPSRPEVFECRECIRLRSTGQHKASA